MPPKVKHFLGTFLWTLCISNSAEHFVTRLSGNFKGLDFTVESLEVVDKALDEAAGYYGEMDEVPRQDLINAAGSYIFEVARRNFGGKYYWHDATDQPILVTGLPEFEVSLLALEKVKGRLINGGEDNIPFYFAGYLERVKDKKSGMIIW